MSGTPISLLLVLSAIVLCVKADVTVQLSEVGGDTVVPLILVNNARNISLVGGNSYQIACISSVGYGSASYAWTNASGGVIPGSGSVVYQSFGSTSTGWTLTFSPFSPAMAGTYYCSIITSSASITISQGNPVAVASQLNVVGTLGATSSAGVMLSCFTSGVPSPTFVLWYFQNQLVGNLSTLVTYPAAPPNQRLSTSVAGTYSCSVVTSAGTATADATVEVDSPPVLYRPLLGSPLAYEGGNITLACVASQGSPLTFSWTFGSTPVSNGGRVSITALNSSASQLTVTQLTYMDAGTYQCTASALPIAQRDSVSMSIIVQYAPILQPLFSYNVTGIENSSAILGLTAMSVPSVVGVVWSGGGSVLVSTGQKYTISLLNSTSPLYNASLTISGLKAADSGSYTCIVSNSFRATSVTFNLMVMTAPVLVPSPSGSQVLGVMGYQLLISVQLLGANPPVSCGGITWLGGGSPLSSGGRIILVCSSTVAVLNITSVMPGDAMNYTLMVPHPAAMRNHSFQLLVKAPPLPPTNLTVSAVSECTFTLGWSPPPLNSSSVPAQQVMFQVRANGSGQWVNVGPAVSVLDTFVVLGQPYVGGAGVLSGQAYQFRSVSLYQLISGGVTVSGGPSVESAFVMANPQGTHTAVGMVTADLGTSQSLVLHWTVAQHSCYIITEYLLTCGTAPTVISNQTTTSGEVVGLSPNTQYNCSVTAAYVDSAGSNFSSSVTNCTFTYPSIPADTVPTLPMTTQVMGTTVKVTITPPMSFVSSQCWVVVLLGAAPAGSPDQLYPAGYAFGQYQTSPLKTRGTPSPYITAEIPLTSQGPLAFTVGDNSTVGGYLNGPLSGGSKYAIFVRYFASSPFVARQYDVFVSTGFLAVQLSSPTTVAPNSVVTPQSSVSIVAGVVGGVVGVAAAVLLIILLVGCVVCYRSRTSKEEERDGHVEASFVPQGTGTFSYTKTDNDKSFLCASPPPSNPPQYSTLPSGPSRPIPVNQEQQKEKEKEKEREMEKQLLSHDIPDGPLPPGFFPPPTYRNLLEAEQMVPSNMKTSEPVPVSDFEQYVTTRDAKKGLLFEKEFKSVQENSPRYPALASEDPQNADKNRYSNIIAFDHTRVRLSPLEGVMWSDYVNANFIKGYPGSTNYIAAQGPLDQTVDDFWRMIWEHNVATVVMLTNIVEEGKAKCFQYWPSAAGTQRYGSLEVKVDHVIILPDHTIRSLSVIHPDGISRSVLHFHYTNWHDYGTPTHLAPLINFIRVVNQSHLVNTPLLVHCSAGVGRTGTVIAIDYCLKQIQEEGVVDVKGVVSLLREQRNFMVQTEQQFMCIHYVLLEAIVCGDTSYTIADFSREYHSLQLTNKETGESLVAEEFKKLNSIKTMISKSSFINRVKHQSASQEYPAYIVKGYHLNTQQFIVADGPCEDTMEQFWQMVAENGCSNIVMLTPRDVQADHYWPPPSQKISFNNISVEVLEEKAEHMYNFRKIVVTNRSGETHQVMQYEFIGWISSELPVVTDFVHFVSEASKAIDENSYTNNAILVHDTTSLGPSGVFCALWYCMERLRLEKVVDVFQAVQKLQLQKPGMVESVKQYAFIYDCIHEFININCGTTTMV